MAAVKISEAFNITLEWLLTGKGGIHKTDDPELSEQCSMAVLSEAQSRKTNLSVAKLAKVIGFVAAQAAQTGETPEAVATKYFDTLE